MCPVWHRYTLSLFFCFICYHHLFSFCSLAIDYHISHALTICAWCVSFLQMSSATTNFIQPSSLAIIIIIVIIIIFAFFLSLSLSLSLWTHLVYLSVTSTLSTPSSCKCYSFLDASSSSSSLPHWPSFYILHHTYIRSVTRITETNKLKYVTIVPLVFFYFLFLLSSFASLFLSLLACTLCKATPERKIPHRSNR